MATESTTVEMEGTTVEEAIRAALEKLGVDRSEAVIEVLEEESKGFFGRISGAKARVRVSVAERAEPAAEAEPGVEKAVALIRDIMRFSNVQGDVEVEDADESIKLNVTGDELGVLIGKHGDTLSAIQTIANVVSRKAGIEKKVIVDVENYRDRRAESLAEMARSAADKAVRYGKRVQLKPMNAYDRRLVHLALQDNNKVVTVSEGEEPSRQVVIEPKR